MPVGLLSSKETQIFISEKTLPDQILAIFYVAAVDTIPMKKRSLTNATVVSSGVARLYVRLAPIQLKSIFASNRFMLIDRYSTR